MARSPYQNRRNAPLGRRRKFAQTLGALAPEVTRPVFEKFGFQRAALMTDWADIIGAPLCHFTAPEEIRWQGAKGSDEALEMGCPPPATLVIRVEGPAALEVQHQTRQIMERINGYFGYKVVGDIRLLQAPLPAKKEVPEIKRYDLDKAIVGEPRLDVGDERLSNALQRMWRGIEAKKRAGS